MGPQQRGSDFPKDTSEERVRSGLGSLGLRPCLCIAADQTEGALKEESQGQSGPLWLLSLSKEDFSVSQEDRVFQKQPLGTKRHLNQTLETLLAEETIGNCRARGDNGELHSLPPHSWANPRATGVVSGELLEVRGSGEWSEKCLRRDNDLIQRD